MYQFNKVRNGSGGWRFELNGIQILLEGYTINNDKHQLINPGKAIAFFSINDNLYGVLNEIRTYNTAEEFYDSMYEQYMIFKKDVSTFIPYSTHYKPAANNSLRKSA
ncbi:MAG: hypothetical protein H0X33_09655 [Taibaiella sp.]|nr:hypothetical protein [Taibaiella sp.]